MNEQYVRKTGSGDSGKTRSKHPRDGKRGNQEKGSYGGGFQRRAGAGVNSPAWLRKRDLREQFQSATPDAEKSGSQRLAEAERLAMQAEKKVAELERQIEQLKAAQGKDAPVKKHTLRMKVCDIAIKYFGVTGNFAKGITNAAVSHAVQQVMATKDQELIGIAPLSHLGIGIGPQLTPKQVEFIRFVLGALCAWLTKKGIAYEVKSDEITSGLGLALTHSPDSHVMAKLRKEAEKRAEGDASVLGDINVPIQPNLGHFNAGGAQTETPDRDVTYVTMVPSPALNAFPTIADNWELLQSKTVRVIDTEIDCGREETRERVEADDTPADTKDEPSVETCAAVSEWITSVSSESGLNIGFTAVGSGLKMSVVTSGPDPTMLSVQGRLRQGQWNVPIAVSGDDIMLANVPVMVLTLFLARRPPKGKGLFPILQEAYGYSRAHPNHVSVQYEVDSQHLPSEVASEVAQIQGALDSLRISFSNYLSRA